MPLSIAAPSAPLKKIKIISIRGGEGEEEGNSRTRYPRPDILKPWVVGNYFFIRHSIK